MSATSFGGNTVGAGCSSMEKSKDKTDTFGSYVMAS